MLSRFGGTIFWARDVKSWLEQIKDYDHGINYHPRKANVVGDALSQKSHLSKLIVERMSIELCEEIDKLNPGCDQY
jgi:hypothetical protein